MTVHTFGLCTCCVLILGTLILADCCVISTEESGCVPGFGETLVLPDPISYTFIVMLSVVE